jgi:hypothetical protein
MRFTRVPEDPSSSAPPPAPPVGVAHEADFNIGDQEISEVAFQTASSQPASAQVDCLAGF